MITKEQLKFLAASAEFQKLLEEDEHIRELEASKYNRREEFLALRSVLLLPSCIGHLRIRPVTPAIWSYLWALGNNYTGDIRKADDMDTDIFLYLLSHDLHDLYDTPAELTGAAIGYCGKNGIDYDIAGNLLCKMIGQAFYALRMLPETSSGGGGMNVYDIDWMTRICSIVAQETHERASYVMFEMSLCACCSYFIQALKKNDTKNTIRKRSDTELCREIYEYTMKLAEAFLRRKGYAVVK